MPSEQLEGHPRRLPVPVEGDGGDGQTAPYRAPAAAPSLKEARRRRTLTARGRRGAALLCWQVQLQAWEGQEATAHALAR
jgi:hypothetical protein